MTKIATFINQITGNTSLSKNILEMRNINKKGLIDQQFYTNWKTINFELWKEKARGKWGEKFDYSEVNYLSYHSKVAIICKKHGLYYQTPAAHIQTGCKACNSGRLSKSEFFDHIKKLNGNKYDYSKTQYSPFTAVNKKIVITCKTHGDFIQTIYSHIDGHGCPRCKNKHKNELYQKNHKLDKTPSTPNVKINVDFGNISAQGVFLVENFQKEDECNQIIDNFKLFAEMVGWNIQIREEQNPRQKEEVQKYDSNPRKYLKFRQIFNSIKSSIYQFKTIL